jgi:hypothetical protein
MACSKLLEEGKTGLMRLFISICALVSLGHVGAFQTRPWLGDFLEFHFVPSFMYRKYPSVNGAYDPSSYSSNDRFTNLNLDVSLCSWDLELGVEFADTRKQSLGTQSAGMQMRYQWLDDVGGPPLSFVSGLNIRWVSKRSLQDVSCPYHAEWNFEIGNALGKEFHPSENCLMTVYGFLGVGQANEGRPWIRGIVSWEAEFSIHHKLELGAEGYFGFGNTRRVNIDHFKGYANIFHQSVDVGIGYYYKINQMWGTLSLHYSYRVFAKDFPSHANTFMIAYNFPFSLF